MKREPHVVLFVRLPVELGEKLDAYAVRQFATKNDLVVRMLEHELRDVVPGTRDPRQLELASTAAPSSAAWCGARDGANGGACVLDAGHLCRHSDGKRTWANAHVHVVTIRGRSRPKSERDARRRS